MPSSQFENYLKNNNTKQFSSQTFSDFRNELLQYANTFYKDQIVDFSEVSLGGMLLDFAAIVGDSLVFYAEQQFNELDYETATDPVNIEKHLRRANIKNSVASPSSVNCTFSIEVPIDKASPPSDLKPDSKLLPIIKKGTQVSSSNGINFILQEDVNFANVQFKKEVGEENEDGTASTLFLSADGLCISGNITREIFAFPDEEKDFFLARELNNTDVTSIISVLDEENNEYNQVDYLTQTTVFKKIENSNENYLTILPSPRRFIREDSFQTGRTLIRFGNGKGKEIKDNMFSNPEDLILPIKGKNNFSRIDLDPSTLLENSTFGISPKGRTLTVTYKYGGGTRHNVRDGSINSVLENPIVVFANNNDLLNDEDTRFIVESLSVTNKNSAVGGSDPLTLDELKAQIPSVIRSQSRIITHEDLIARIMTMPSDFGRINKAVALENNVSAGSVDLYVICKDNEGFYTEASDAIKTNLSRYINEYRLIGSNFNILDVPVFNFGIAMKINVKSGFDPFEVIFDVNSRIVETMRFDLFQIGTPINVNELIKVVEATGGVHNIITNRKSIVVSKTEEDSFFDMDDLTTRQYNKSVFNPLMNYREGLIYPQRGGLFEMRYTARDIIIAAQ
jgi:hypothetical protein